MRLVIKERSDTYGDIYGSPGSPNRAGRTMNTMEETNLQDAPLHRPIKHTAMLDECGCGCDECGVGAHHETPFEFEIEDEEYPEMVIHPDMIRGLYDQPEMIYITITEAKRKKKKKGDRCIRIAKRKYHKWPSAYASGAVVKCRQGKIWKGLKESKDSILFEIIELTESQAEQLLEKYKPVKQKSLKDWFSQNQGKGWIDCRTGKPCGRSKAGRGTDRKYPACRPTKAHCNKAGSRRKKGPARVSWKPKKDK